MREAEGNAYCCWPNGPTIQEKSVREILFASFSLRRPMPPKRRNARETAAVAYVDLAALKKKQNLSETIRDHLPQPFSPTSKEAAPSGNTEGCN
jgi:hypothetical protein